MRTVWVTYKGIMVTFIPELNTMDAASGSTKILNYADGDQFPSPIAPPMIVIPDIFYSIFGKTRISKARFVMAPVTTKFILLGCDIIFWYTLNNESSSTAFLVDFFNSAPSSPLSPWIYGATSRSPSRGLELPLYTSMSSL